MDSDSDDSSYRDIKDIETHAEWPESPRNMQKVCMIAAGLGVVEYACVCVFYRMGLEKLVYPAMALQALFFTIAATVDYKIYKKIGSPFRNKTVKTIMLIPVSCLNIPLWFFHLVALSPNYIHVTSTAITAGGIWNVWEEAKFQGVKRLFQKHWAYVPLVGGLVGNAGLPWIMTVLLLFSCFVHLLIIIGLLLLGQQPDARALVGEVCDAANLQFLTKAMKRAGWEDVAMAPPAYQENFQYSRLLTCALIKYPMLWAKTSMLAVTYEFMDDAMFQSTMISLALAWYSILQLTPGFFGMSRVLIKEAPDIACPVVCLFGMLCLGLFQQALHLFGVFYCSESHDFSVMVGGCSPA